MKDQLETALADEFPFMRRELSAREQRERFGGVRNLYEAFGLEMSDGWFALVRDMCAEITAAYEAEGGRPDIVVDQAKEKFGTLRFYYHHEGQDIPFHAIDSLSGGGSLRIRPGASEIQRKAAEIVSKYEEKSAHVCEICGKPGELRTDLSWHRTLCGEHYQAALK